MATEFIRNTRPAPRRALRNVRMLFGVIPLLFLITSLLLQAAPQTNKNNQKQLQDLRTHIDTLQKNLVDKKSSKTKAANALSDSERLINNSYNKLAQLERQQNIVQSKLVRLQNRSAKLQNEVNTGQIRLGKLVYYQHLVGYKDYLRLSLRQQDPDETVRKLYYYSYIARASSHHVDNLLGKLTILNTLAHETRIQNEALKQIQKEQLDQKHQLEQEKSRQSEILASLSREVTQQQEKIDRLKQDERRLSNLIKKLNKQLARKKNAPNKAADKTILRNNKVPDATGQKGPFAALKGKLRLPVRGEITNRFGSSREGGGVRWQGLFIRSSSGDKVKAIASGQVIFADWLRGFGNLMILDHGNNYMSLYGNNEAIYKRAGNQVKSGDTIAIVGNSGGNTESGLYFELRYQGKPFDPLTWVKIE